MKNTLLFMLLIILISCSKDENTPETINYTNEIFFGEDTLIYGKWEYLITYDGWRDHYIQINKAKFLTFIPIGKFQSSGIDTVYMQGTVDTLTLSENNIGIRLHPDGKEYRNTIPYEFNFNGQDTMIMNMIGFDVPYDYYKRVK
jgi:hypothetical protein